jgi:diketogulonate reductase-like aldo/keto reductase
MGMSRTYRPTDETESKATIRAARGTDIIPLIGTKRRDRLAAALGALSLDLGADELAAIEAAVPPVEVAGSGMTRPAWPHSTGEKP